MDTGEESSDFSGNSLTSGNSQSFQNLYGI